MFEFKKILKENMINAEVKKISDDRAIVFTDKYSILTDSKNFKFLSPQFTKLTDFITVENEMVATFEIALPYLSDKMAPTNHLYGVIDIDGNVVGGLCDFKSKQWYEVTKYDLPESISNEGIKKYNFMDLINILSNIEEKFYISELDQRDKCMNMHLDYKKHF